MLPINDPSRFVRRSYVEPTQQSASLVGFRIGLLMNALELKSFAVQVDDDTCWKYTVVADVLSDLIQPRFPKHSLVCIDIGCLTFGTVRYIRDFYNIFLR